MATTGDLVELESCGWSEKAFSRCGLGVMSRMRLENPPLKINIASGVYVLPGYINYDNSINLLLVPLRGVLRYVLSRPRVKGIESFYEAKKKADLFYRDCTKPLNFPDNSVDEIYCSHFLEHVYRSEAVSIVKDFYRVLKKGGKLVIIVPDLEEYISQYLKADDEHKRADQFIEKTLLTHSARPSCKEVIKHFLRLGPNHKWLYDAGSMSAIVKECGFGDVNSEKVPEESVKITAVK